MNMLKKLSEDVRELYCKTGNKALEASYISILASLEGMSDDDIISWIGKGGISKKVSDKFTLSALMALKNINPAEMENFNSWLVGITSPAYGGSGLSKYLNYFIIFADIMDDPEAALVLRPFQPVLNKIRDNKDILGKPTINDVPVISDVKAIQRELEKDISGVSSTSTGEAGGTPTGGGEEGGTPTDTEADEETRPNRYEVDRQETGQETKQEKVQNLYDDVYLWISQDAASALSSAGLNELAQKINSGAIGNPYALEDYYRESGLDRSYGTPAINSQYQEIASKRFVAPAIRNMNKYIKSPRGHVDFYRDLTEFVMSTLNQVDGQEVENIKRERSKMRGALPRTMEEYYERDNVGEEPEISVKDESWALGSVIGMTSYILYKIYENFNLG